MAASATAEIGNRKKKHPEAARASEWVALQVARAPKLTKARLAKIRQLLLG